MPPPSVLAAGGGVSSPRPRRETQIFLRLPSASRTDRASEHDTWPTLLRRMLLRESQIQAALERHIAVVPEPVRARYGSLLRISQKRTRALEMALGARGQRIEGRWVSMVRALGRLTGRLTSRGSLRRVVSMDIEGIRGLEAGYFRAFEARPPHDIRCMLESFIGDLEVERTALIESVKPLFRL